MEEQIDGTPQVNTVREVKHPGLIQLIQENLAMAAVLNESLVLLEEKLEIICISDSFVDQTSTTNSLEPASPHLKLEIAIGKFNEITRRIDQLRGRINL